MYAHIPPWQRPCLLLLLAACAPKAAPRGLSLPRRVEPPARSIAVSDGRVALRASAYVELHAWLAGAARTGEAMTTPELEKARRAYVRSLADDDDDARLERTTRALSACSDDRCASAALRGEGFGRAFDRALPGFVAHAWLGRATEAWSAIEATRAALGPSAEAIFVRAANDLQVKWPDQAVPVDIVSEAPPVGRTALIPVALGTRSRCFARGTREDMQDARILDCVLVQALLATRNGPLHETLVRELGEKEGERAWSLLAIHAVAALVTAWEPKHRSVYRRSAEVAEREALEWLAREWPSADFASKYAEFWRTRPTKPR